MKKTLALLLVVVMVCALFAGCKPEPAESVKKGEFTYNSYTTALGNNWNPHSWETNGDSGILGYLETPFVDMSIKDSENGVYQWIYLAADSIEDVTKDHKDDLDKYKVTLPEGKTSADIEAGYVYEIKLNQKMKWENGTAINADSYIYSMKQLLDPKMRNYRANLYYAGESAVAGGNAYFNSGAPIYDAMPAGSDLADGTAYITTSGTTTFTSSYTLQQLNTSYLGGAHDAIVNALAEKENIFGYAPVTAENVEAVKALLNDCMALFGLDAAAGAEYIHEWFVKDNGEKWPEVAYDGTVGCYKVDDYTIRYVCQTALEKPYFLTSCTSSWLVYEDYYEAGKDTSGNLVTTDYGTKMENTMSYGPYKIASLENDKQIVFVQNENWYDWEKVDDQLVSYTDFEVDGKKVQQYQATKIVIDVIAEPASQKSAFLKGDLTDWAPEADDLITYGTSEQMYKADETYTMSFFFNTDVKALQEMDASKGNKNSVVLSNVDFRKAMSLAIDRADWVKTTAGYTPAFSLMNKLYHYDVYNDPESSYRRSDAAMQAICNLYGVEYGEGKAYATLKEAHDAINGYNLTEAKNLMKAACDKLVADGLYKAGEDITINIGWAKGAITTADEAQVTQLEAYFNAAVEGSGFGKIDLVAVGSIDDRYGAVPSGEYAIGYGAWGGAAFYPFRNFQVYCDPDQYSINEAACWDPKTETLTLTVAGKEETLTWQEWSQSMVGTGKFANLDNAEKLKITAAMEEAYLKFYYRIPMASSTVCSMLAYKVSYYTEDYNIMYGWGGLRLLKFNYNDAEWAEYVASQGGTLSYE